MNAQAPTLPLYDAHCHLADRKLGAYLPKVFEDLHRVGIRRAVVNGTQEDDWPAVLQLAATQPILVPSIGLHPWYVAQRKDNWFFTLSESARAHRCGIGEVGLDRWIEGYDLPAQEEVFVRQLALAADLNRPLSIHCLKAWGRLLEILSVEKLPSTGFLLHSYGGPAEMVEKFVELGAYFSFSGYFAHPRKEKQRNVFKRVPLDRLLIETDAPDMPLPAELCEFSLGTELNHPANLRAVYKFAAEFLDLQPHPLSARVEKNFSRFFANLL